MEASLAPGESYWLDPLSFLRDLSPPFSYHYIIDDFRLIHAGLFLSYMLRLSRRALTDAPGCNVARVLLH